MQDHEDEDKEFTSRF